MQNQFVLGFISIIDMMRETNDLYCGISLSLWSILSLSQRTLNKRQQHPLRTIIHDQCSGSSIIVEAVVR